MPNNRSGERFDWPARVATGAVVRKLGKVPRDEALYLERIDQPDCLIDDRDLVDLDREGIESFISRKQHWKLNVHGVVIEAATPTITADAAMAQAGFDITKPWHIYFKVAGAPKREVQLDTVLDLETPRIEKLRLSPRDVGNGEAPPAPRRDFALLDADSEYLDRLKLRWETIEEDDQRRWLVIHNYPVPAGYAVSRTLLALGAADLSGCANLWLLRLSAAPADFGARDSEHADARYDPQEGVPRLVAQSRRSRLEPGRRQCRDATRSKGCGDLS